MKLKSLDIENFRGIAKLHLEFGERLTVIVGENGVGKTSVLDALAILLDQYIARFVHGSPRRARKILEADVGGQARFNAFCTASLAVSFRDNNEAPVDWNVVYREKISKKQSFVKWRTAVRDSNKKNYSSSLDNFINKITGDNSMNRDSPLFAFYGQKRSFFDSKKLKNIEAYAPADAFNRALNGDFDFRDFKQYFVWLGRIEDNNSDVALQSVNRAISAIPGNYDALYIPGSSLLISKNNTRNSPYDINSILNFDQLSSGEKIMIALLGDVSRRLSILNPKSENPLLCDGLVLIDEIELNLHPRWQRIFLPILLETFPGCQFVVTTHSPQVLGEVAAANIRVLRASKEGFIESWIPDATYGRDSNHILLHVLGADERDGGLKDDLDALDDAIANGRLQVAAEKLAELREKIEGSPPELTIAQARLERRQRQRGQEE
jgi:predicted ATP-binding protein involved in virulence